MARRVILRIDNVEIAIGSQIELTEYPEGFPLPWCREDHLVVKNTSSQELAELRIGEPEEIPLPKKIINKSHFSKKKK